VAARPNLLAKHQRFAARRTSMMKPADNHDEDLPPDDAVVRIRELLERALNEADALELSHLGLTISAAIDRCRIDEAKRSNR
jgi:hypothetical protein